MNRNIRWNRVTIYAAMMVVGIALMMVVSAR